MKTIFLLAFLLFLAASLGMAEQIASLPTTEAVDAGNIICPVSGKSINSNVTSVYAGKKYSFCCKSCLAKFEKNPEKYTASLGESGGDSHGGDDHAGHSH